MNISLRRPLPANVGRLSQLFGEHPEWYAKYGQAGHCGLDYGAPLGTPVLAMHDGVCVTGTSAGGYGNHVRINASRDGKPFFQSLYSHLDSINVCQGQLVKAGDLIGTVGSTGNSTGPHLHMALAIYGMKNPAYSNYIDPIPFRDI